MHFSSLLSPPFPLSVFFVIDLHCHILPGLDDGPSDMEESLAMAEMAVADGIETIVATPHTLNKTYTNSFDQVVDGVDRMREALSREHIALSLLPGSDAHLCPKMADRIEAGDAGTLNGNGRYLLVEFPPQTIPPGANDVLFQLRIKGITPIITHPERNLAIQDRLEMLSDLVATGCLTQVTAMSITGEFGEEAMVCAHRMLEMRLAHIIASDAHSPDSRPPILSHAVGAAADIMGSRSEAEDMVRDRPAAILAGEDVVVPEPGRPKKKRWWFG